MGFFRIFRVAVFVVTAAAFVLAIGFAAMLRPVDRRAVPVSSFFIPTGESVRAIGAGLESAGLIRSRSAFTLWSVFAGVAHRLRPGAYLISAASSTPAIVRELRRGASPETVLIVEGATLREIDKELARRGVIKSGEIASFSVSRLSRVYPFLADASSLEGFLFPDTYRWSVGAGAEEALRTMLENFSVRAWPVLRSSGDDWYESLIAASLIEKEVHAPRERELVSGIIRKRLAIGMPLQIDATVVYAACKGVFSGCASLQKFDYRIASPYNTYDRLGLPPAPIGNPGLGAITAALEPRVSSYLFYLTNPRTGRAVFAETFEEHNENRAWNLGL